MASGWKRYCVVSFVNEDDVEMIPGKWVKSKTCAYWPNVSSMTKLHNYIRDCETPSEKWDTVNIKLYGHSNSFKQAKNMAGKALLTSNVGSDSSEEEAEIHKRKKLKPKRYLSFEESDDEASSHAQKLKNSGISSASAISSCNLPAPPAPLNTGVRTSVPVAAVKSPVPCVSKKDSVTPRQSTSSSPPKLNISGAVQIHFKEIPTLVITKRIGKVLAGARDSDGHRAI